MTTLLGEDWVPSASAAINEGRTPEATKPNTNQPLAALLSSVPPIAASTRQTTVRSRLGGRASSALFKFRSDFGTRTRMVEQTPSSAPPIEAGTRQATVRSRLGGRTFPLRDPFARAWRARD
jgi:hypothetical protein